MSWLLNVLNKISTNKTRKLEKFDKNIHSSFRSLNPNKLKWNASFLVFSIQSNVEDKPLALGWAPKELDEEIVVHQKFVMSLYSPETILSIDINILLQSLRKRY